MKAVLVTDMPVNGCESCMFDTYGICLVRANEKDIDKRANRNWCPLKPLPQKKTYEEPTCLEEYKVSQMLVMANADGWNACLEEILGETE